MKSNYRILSKIATNERHGENSPYFDGWKAYDMNPFDPVKNPRGVIQMGLAENQLCFDVIEDWIKKNPKASICTSEGAVEFKDIAIFQDYHGLSEFRKAIAKFMGKVRGGRVAFDPDRIVMSGGATGANELLMFCLADPGDAFLVPSPYYPAFDRDLRWRTGVQIIPVKCHSSNNFQITKAALEVAYDKALEAGFNVKGILVANPSNPLGTVLDKEKLKGLVQFVNEKNIHFVCDEIYAATVFRSPNFTSIPEVMQEMMEEDCNNINSDLIHIIYSLSKDMGLPGFRVGIVYSYNDAVVCCGRKMSSFGLVSSQTQYLLASMLNDEEFIERFLAESAKRLEKRHRIFTETLERVGIGCLRSSAGLFVWMDLRHLLKEPTYQSEMELWRAIIDEVKLNFSPGSSFHCAEPGWFRVCFAIMDDGTVEVALRRIQAFVLKGKRQEKETPKASEKAAKRWQKSLRLISKSRRFEDGPMLMSPHTMSPHSPVPHSPLLLATT